MQPVRQEEAQEQEQARVRQEQGEPPQVEQGERRQEARAENREQEEMQEICPRPAPPAMETKTTLRPHAISMDERIRRCQAWVPTKPISKQGFQLTKWAVQNAM
jgi:hypothetical protein